MSADDEFDIIERYFTRLMDDPDVLVGPGDDAAVVRARGDFAIAVDTLVSGVHFPREMKAESIGYRSLAVNLSDMAAMGAMPRWMTLALTVDDPGAAWLQAFSTGLFELAERYDVSVIGGDLTRGPLAVSVQIIGQVDGQALTRSGATSGDDVYITGGVGLAAAGLSTFGRSSVDSASALLRRSFERPEPRVDAGIALRGLASAAIDVSDGLCADLGHICERSGCGAVIDVDSLPLDPIVDAGFDHDTALAFALGGGDDYELCFPAPSDRRESVASALRSVGAAARRIGEIKAETGIVCRSATGVIEPPAAGFKHF
jgi:thiamine-monophosphate kinase